MGLFSTFLANQGARSWSPSLVLGLYHQCPPKLLSFEIPEIHPDPNLPGAPNRLQPPRSPLPAAALGSPFERKGDGIVKLFCFHEMMWNAMENISVGYFGRDCFFFLHINVLFLLSLWSFECLLINQYEYRWADSEAFFLCKNLDAIARDMCFFKQQCKWLDVNG